MRLGEIKKEGKSLIDIQFSILLPSLRRFTAQQFPSYIYNGLHTNHFNQPFPDHSKNVPRFQSINKIENASRTIVISDLLEYSNQKEKHFHQISVFMVRQKDFPRLQFSRN